MTTSEANAQTVGGIAFKNDIPLSSNPYVFPRPCDQMKRLAAAWERGWKAAQTADWQFFPMAGRA